MDVKDFRINEHIFEEALRKKLSDETVKVLGVTCYPLSEKGLNFLSDLYQICVKHTMATKNARSRCLTNMVVKIEPSNEISCKIVREQDLFLTELKVLRDVLPRIKQFVHRQLGPILLYGSDNPHFLIMEDLIKKGFTMKDRQKGLPFEHCCLAMEQIARFHAGSVAVLEKDPEMITSFKDGGILSATCPEAYLRLTEASLLRIATQIQKWSDEKCVAAANKLIRLTQTVVKRCLDVYNYDANEFCVLNHGDCWVNNMMFKENEKGHPVDLILVDYQMAVYSSPAIDLLYFLNICPEFDVKYDYDDYFLKVYSNTLEETMRNIGCKTKPPTIEQLKQAIHKRRIYAVFSGIVLYLRMMANKEDTEDFTEVFGKFSGETRMNVFKNPDAVKLARKMIPIMDERGYFD